MEDNDIKIFKKKPKDDAVDGVALIAEMNAQRSNGNTEKAKQLGKYLASRFLNRDELRVSLTEAVGSIDYPKNVVFQIRILMFFIAEYCINRILPNTLLKTTAINRLYDSITKNDNEFYSEFSDGVEYSFYYLAVKKDDVPLEIGKTFAMLCGKENEEKFVALGTKLFSVVAKEVESIIDSYEFVR